MPDTPLFERVVREFTRLAGGTMLLLDFTSGDIDADLTLLEQMIAAHDETPRLRLWTRSQSLVTSPRLARLDGFPAAAARSAARGWPVVVRPSAGLTVAHHGGVLNISRLSLAPESGGPYDALLALLEEICARLGLAADHGAVPGAYCDGAHNLRIGGRKLAGLSARLITRQGRRGLLAHACLTVAGDVSRDVAAVRDFERALGLPADYSAAAHCSLESCLSNCDV